MGIGDYQTRSRDIHESVDTRLSRALPHEWSALCAAYLQVDKRLMDAGQ